MKESSARNYKKALACLRDFDSGQSACGSIASDGFLENWLVFMFQQGLSRKTSVHYLDIVSGLYGAAVNDGITEWSDGFARVKARVLNLEPDSWRQPVSEERFSRLLSVTRLADRQTGELSVATDLLLFSLLNRGMALSDVARLRRSDLDAFGLESRRVAARHTDLRRKYVFPLGQAAKTDKQLDDHVGRLVSRLLGYRNIELPGTAQDTVRCYWAYAALRCGVSGAAVVGTLGRRPAGMPVLGLCENGGEIPAERQDAVSRAVAAMFVDNPESWYAMRLRPGVRFASLVRRFDELGGRVTQPELFYPCDEIARRIRKKLVYELKPVLPDIVFFKSRVTDILPMFAKIGDIAWCYKHDGSYAAIPKGAMERFQRTIGKFTPDYEVGPAGSIELRKGDRVVVVGGPFAGQEGEILDEPGVIYRIRLFGGANDIEWRVNDPRLITRQPPKAV